MPAFDDPFPAGGMFALGAWQARYIFGGKGDLNAPDESGWSVPLPALRDGAVGIELTPAE